MKYIRDHIVSIIIIGILAILSFGSLFIDLNTLREAIASAGPLAPILYILVKASTVIFAPLSGTALYIFSAPLFGFWNALLYSFTGDLIGSVVTFYISRLFGRPVVEYFAGKKNMPHIEDALELMATTKGFLTMRLAAISMPEIASYAAGLTKINFWFFISIHMAIDFVAIVVMTLPGLFFVQEFPKWLVIAGAASVGVVTIGSILVFVFMLKAAHKKHQAQKENLNK